MDTNTVRLSDVISPHFKDVHLDIKRGLHTDYWLKGGRGSTKSSFISLEIIQEIIKDPNANAVCFRKVADTLKDSVFTQLLWAIETLKVSDYFKYTLSPLKITYLPTEQHIIFRGCDEVSKIKSIKCKKGYFKIAWFEELAEFDGMEEIRNIVQSIMRGGERYSYFYSYNPPLNSNNWVNLEVQLPDKDRLISHSTYLDVPRHWLGEQFFIKAEHLKQVNELSYRHEYLGEAVGTGGTVFPNVISQRILDSDIKLFDNIKHGIDWGYATDPFVYIQAHYDSKHKTLYIIDEIYKVGLLNDRAVEFIKPKYDKSYGYIIADSSEPKSIADLQRYGLMIKGADKGKDSVRYGIKWLQGLEKIIIDPLRTPNAWREFANYELEKNKNGDWKDDYPDKDNHTIDAVRYLCEQFKNNINWGESLQKIQQFR